MDLTSYVNVFFDTFLAIQRTACPSTDQLNKILATYKYTKCITKLLGKELLAPSLVLAEFSSSHILNEWLRLHRPGIIISVQHNLHCCIVVGQEFQSRGCDHFHVLAEMLLLLLTCVLVLIIFIPLFNATISHVVGGRERVTSLIFFLLMSY